MDVNTTLLKVKQRLNKLDSSDYDNIQCWQIREAINKAQLEWVRRQVHGTNIHKEGDEQTRMRVDDLQPLLVSINLSGINSAEGYFESDLFPDNYLYQKRLRPYASSTTCENFEFYGLYPVEESNVNDWYYDTNKEPNEDWAETFYTFIGNKVRVYTANKFLITSTDMVYYRKPVEFNIAGCNNVDETSGVDSPLEFKDDVAELIIDDAAAILASDIESLNQEQILKQNSEQNN
jgi:hypothetical protein